MTNEQQQPRKKDAFEIAQEALLERYGTTDPVKLVELNATFVEIGAAKNINTRNGHITER